MKNRDSPVLLLGVLLCALSAISMVGDILGDSTILGAIILGILGIMFIAVSQKYKQS